MPSFPGFPKETLTFFRKLRRNNNRDWFNANKTVYEENVKKPTVDLVNALNQWLAGSAPSLVTDPKRAIYRIYRDTRFSKDKTPYKTHSGALFFRDGLGKHTSGSLYVAISASEVEVAGGVYMPGPEELRCLRDWIASEHKTMTALVTDRKVVARMGELKGEQLSRLPKPYPKDHPAEGLLRNKQWYFYTTLEPELATTPKLLHEITLRFGSMLPFVDFMSRPLQARRKGEAARWG